MPPPGDRLTRYAALGVLGRAFTHEFNNVLGGILGSAQLLAMKPEDRERAERLATIVQSVQRGMALTQAFANVASTCDGAYADAHQVIQGMAGSCALAPLAEGALAASAAGVRMDAELLAGVIAALAAMVADPGRAGVRTCTPPADAAERQIEVRLAGSRHPSARARAVIEGPLQAGLDAEALPLAAAAAAVRMARGRIGGEGATVSLRLPLG